MRRELRDYSRTMRPDPIVCSNGAAPCSSGAAEAKARVPARRDPPVARIRPGALLLGACVALASLGACAREADEPVTTLEASLEGGRMAEHLSRGDRWRVVRWIRHGAREADFGAVLPIFEESCTSCHNATDMPHLPLETYAQVYAYILNGDSHKKSRLEASLDGHMAEYIEPEERLLVLRWLWTGATEAGFAKVQPIFEERCANCHNEKELPDIPLGTFDQIIAFLHGEDEGGAVAPPVTPLETSLDGSMAEYVEPEQKAEVVAWLRAGAAEADYASVQPIFEESCVPCHNPDEMPEMPLTAYAEVAAFAAVAGAAPPTPLELSLNESMAEYIEPADKAVVVAWVRGGASQAEFGPVEAILAESCVPCHNPDDMPEFPLATYEQVVAFAPVAGDSEGSATHFSPLHPAVRFVDANGTSVLQSGGAVSPIRTCGQCHDTQFIAGHSYHVNVGLGEYASPGEVDGGRPWDTSPGLFGRWDPLTYRLLTPLGDPRLDVGTADWIRLVGTRHVGGGPAALSRTGQPLTDLRPGVTSDPETHVLAEGTDAAEVWNWDESGIVEMNCFLCHIPNPDNAARKAELQAGRFQWAATATLAGTGLVRRTAAGWEWDQTAFTATGAASRRVLGIGDPQSSNCGLCHGVVTDHPDTASVRGALDEWRTETTGQIYSAETVAESDMRLADRARLQRPWDLHAKRLLQCTNCHYSLNNPLYQDVQVRPQHLRFEARRTDIGEYLKRPSHDFAKGTSPHASGARELQGTMRRCESCHDIGVTHGWLPYKQRHLNAMTCEACHIPKIYAPARQETDWTVLTPAGTPRIAYRGMNGPIDSPETVIEGYTPVLFPRAEADGRVRLGPHNLITSWFWVTGAPERPVRLRDLRAAFFTGDAYAPEVVAALDANRDGAVQERELVLDTPAKVETVRARLVAAGVETPRIRGEIQPFSLHHNVTNSEWVTKDCQVCHVPDSRLTRPFVLASAVPGSVMPDLVPDAAVRLAGTVRVAESGRLLYEPNSKAEGRYILGSDRWPLIDLFGILAVIGVVLGAGLHGVLRIVLRPRHAVEDPS